MVRRTRPTWEIEIIRPGDDPLRFELVRDVANEKNPIASKPSQRLVGALLGSVRQLHDQVEVSAKLRANLRGLLETTSTELTAQTELAARQADQLRQMEDRAKRAEARLDACQKQARNLLEESDRLEADLLRCQGARDQAGQMLLELAAMQMQHASADPLQLPPLPEEDAFADPPTYP